MSRWVLGLQIGCSERSNISEAEWILRPFCAAVAAEVERLEGRSENFARKPTRYISEPIEAFW
jgi:hypothetical protein